MKYIVGTQELCLTLNAETNFLKCYVYAAFTVNSDFKSHKGAILTMGKGAIVSVSQKKKTEYENQHRIQVGR